MKRTKRFKKEKSRRGIYILPNIFTSLNLFFGFYAVIASVNGKFVDAAVAFIIGVLFDIMDGNIVRATNTPSKFGIEYDSFADLISFGLCPWINDIFVGPQALRKNWLAGGISFLGLRGASPGTFQFPSGHN